MKKNQEVETVNVETVNVETAEVDKAEVDNIEQEPKKVGFWKSKTGKNIIRVTVGLIAFGLGATAASYVNSKKNGTATDETEDDYSEDVEITEF